MNYRRKWSNYRNAAGFAASCARLALPFYRGSFRSDLVTAIEAAERYANGEQIDRSDIIGVADAIDTFCISASASNDAARTASCAAYAAANAAYYGTATTTYAARAGVDTSEIQIAYARWVTRDLAGDRELPEELRQAAGAAIVAGDEELAKELLR